MSLLPRQRLNSDDLEARCEAPSSSQCTRISFCVHLVAPSRRYPGDSLGYDGVAALTAVYAVLTFEIVLQNQKMTKAASESANVMERSLRFSYTPNLIFVTLVTKDPTLISEHNFMPFKNEDYLRACKDLPPAEQTTEFVFAVVRNVGKGPATKVLLKAQYDVKEKTNPNYNFMVKREASAALLKPDNAIALIIHVARSPSAEDGVQLISASLSCGDFYRDALGEIAQIHTFT